MFEIVHCTVFFRRPLSMVVFALTLVRHGETGHNKDNVIQGQLDVPLSTTGIQQAKMLGAHLRHQQYSHIYVSDLSRAKQTADGIVRQNLSYTGCLVHDSRLRERKFGDIEGKSFKYLKQAAGNVGRKIGEYTPPGGETVQQVHDRAISFFQDLCQTIAETQVQCEDKLPKNNSSFQNTSSINCCSVLKSMSFCSTIDSFDKIIHGKKRKGESLENECVKKMDCVSQTVQMSTSQTKNSCAEKAKVPFGNCLVETQNTERLSSASETNLQFNATCESISGPIPLQEDSNVCTDVSSQRADSIERRLSVCSSGDDGDLSIEMVANVLVVSHGGFIRELLRYFVDELECSVPGGKQQALRISPNAALSKFTVSIEETGQNPRVICHQIHDKEYLISDSSGKKTLNTINDTAL